MHHIILQHHTPKACKTIGTAAAKIGAFPFTTIEPNIGRGSFRAEYPAVIQCKTPEERSHSIEIVLKDVAGLVPGAYQGTSDNSVSLFSPSHPLRRLSRLGIDGYKWMTGWAQIYKFILRSLWDVAV